MSHDSLIATLTDPDLETRQSAFEDVYADMDDSLAGSIVDIATSDRSPEIRADAIVALGPVIEECSIDFEDGLPPDPDMGPAISMATFRSVVQRLRAIYDDAKQAKIVRRRAFEVLVRDPQAWQEDEIRKQLASPDEEWRVTALFAMGSMPGFEQDVLDAVKTREGVELGEAVRAAAKMEIRKAAPRIRELAESDDTEQEVRIEAILALPHVDRDAFELLEELADSNEDDVADAAREALEELLMHEGIDEEFGGDGD